MASLSETLANLRELEALMRGCYHGVRKAENELKEAGVEVPEHFKRSLFHLGMYLDEVAVDLEQLTK